MAITFVTDEQTVESKVGDKIIDLCDKNNLSVPFGCQNGNCATCLSTIVSGAEHLNLPSDKEKNTLALFTKDSKHRLLCQCHIVSEGDITIEH